MEEYYPENLYLTSDLMSESQVMSWKHSVISHFQHNQTYTHFLPGGIYSSWNPAGMSIDGWKRIPELSCNDPDKINLEQNLSSAGQDVSQQLAGLLSQRNSQLQDFIQVIKKLSNGICEEAVNNQSTSLESIINIFLQLISNMSSPRVSNILEISDIQRAEEEEFNMFYDKVRNAVCSILRKKGDKVSLRGDKTSYLQEDEVLSPTFEEMIILWCLDKISPILPREVNRVYGAKLSKTHCSLLGIQEEIFMDIPNLMPHFVTIEADVDTEHMYIKRDDKMLGKQKNDIQISSSGSNLGTTTVTSYVTADDEMETKCISTYSLTTAGFENIKLVDETGRVLTTGPDSTGILSDFVGSLSTENLEVEATNFSEDVTLKDPIQLVKIVTANVSEQVHECEVCNKHFSTRKKLLDHRRVHLPKKEEMSKCDECGKMFNTRKALTDHRRRSHNVEFPCPDCSLVFLNEKKLELHKFSHNNYSCQVCAKTHSSYKELYHHRKVHEEKVKCEECGKQFRKNNSLKKHMQVHHSSKDTSDVKKLNCDTCKKTFNQMSTLLAHQKTHHQPQPSLHLSDLNILDRSAPPPLTTDKEGNIKIAPKDASTSCDICSKSFATKYELIQHKEIHLKSSVIICPICGRSQSSKEELEHHLTIHNKDPHSINIISHPVNNGGKDGVILIQNGNTMIRVLPSLVPEVSTPGEDGQNAQHRTKKTPEVYECDFCHKVFQTHKSLNIHRKSIHSDKNICFDCGVSFPDKQALSIHSKEHTIRNLTCEVCGKSFSHKSVLDQHLKRHDDDGERRSLYCVTCSRSFNSEEQMNSHVCRHHACDMCDMKFVKFKNLKNHKLIHEGVTIFSCDQCESLFQNRRRLTEHKRNTHNANRKYKCELCPKAFINTKGLRNHELVHSGERPHTCSECGNSFRQKGALVSHFRMHTKETPYECAGCQQKFRTLGNLKSHRERQMCGFTVKDLFQGSNQGGAQVET